jgi:hypothetical protein
LYFKNNNKNRLIWHKYKAVLNFFIKNKKIKKNRKKRKEEICLFFRRKKRVDSGQHFSFEKWGKIEKCIGCFM